MLLISARHFAVAAGHLALAALLLAGSMACEAGSGSTTAPDRFGVLVMAHGGPPEWNQAVLDAVAPLKDRYPLEVAFGMADAASIQQGISQLEAEGVRRIGVVRLFVSGESWYERTEQILGLGDGAPSRSASGPSDRAGPDANPHADHHDHLPELPPVAHGQRGNGSHPDQGQDHAGPDQHPAAFFRVETVSQFAMSKPGLADEPEMAMVLVDRAKQLSRKPEDEDVLVLAHGPADDQENQRWLADLDARADQLRRAFPFHRVQVQTLREDWPEKREAAEANIRDFVSRAARDGRRVIVIPFRVYGFGPYAEVLHGLPYISDGRGLLPDPRVTQWIARQAAALRAGSFRRPLGSH